VLAGRRHGIPVRGTHAHAWVMVFEDEPEAFAAYARALPNNCVFLVDTYSTRSGVAHAIEAGRALRARGHEMIGVRLDSGDLGALAVDARAALDAAGFPEAVIVASNDLDEHSVAALKAAGAPIGVWGVGTRLVTADDQPSLGGVYKLGALRGADGRWEGRVKLSETPVKISDPGCLQVRRRVDPSTGRFAGDELWDELAGPPAALQGDDHDLLVPQLRGGLRVDDPVPLAVARARARAQLMRLPDDQLQLRPPRPYPIDRSPELDARRSALIARARAFAGGAR
jgi:nicotinate phosphoribosyltransferase